MHSGIVKILFLLLFQMESMKISCRNSSERSVAIIPGDFMIGLFVSVHHQPKSKKADPRDFLKCGEIREHYGIQRTEIALKTIDEINANKTLLPNITLGIEIRDSCWYAPVALQQSIEMIKDTISPKMSSTQTCSVEETPEYHKKSGQLIAVVGPGSSSVALQVQNLLQLFSIPQIGYSTTSKDLSDKARFSTFMRVVPSDYYQAKVMVDIVKKFNWSYVSVVNTDENYGQSGIQAFRELAEKNGVCIAKDSSILSNDDDEKFNAVIDNLSQDTNANVVVCFCEGMTIRGLLKAMKSRNASDRFLLIGTDGWADRTDVVEGYEQEALGSISIRIHSPRVDSFDSYYCALKPHKNDRNPWFKEFWASKFNCTLQPDEHDDLLYEDRSNATSQKPYCTYNESLSYNYHQEPKLSFLIKAIYTIAYALDTLQENICGLKIKGKCDAMKTFNGTQFFEYLKNVTFTYPPNDGDVVKFDKRGDPPGRYEIINYQLLNGSYEYVKVGEWKNGALNVQKQLYGFDKMVIESVCSQPCDSGFYRQHQSGGQEQKCCWACVPCESHQYLLNVTHCQNCSKGEKPNDNKTGCIVLPHEYVKWDDSEAIISISIGIFGFIVTFIVLLIFVQYNNTPVVKASTRELCYLILIGMMLSHVSILFFIARPNEIFCTVNRILPGISFSMIYASLLVKTNRIARILAGSKKRFPTRKPRFMSAGAQLVLTSILILIEGAIAIGMVIYEPANATLVFPMTNSKPRVLLECNTTRIGVLSPLGFIFLLIGMCTLYALKTRNVPENFNEAKFVGFAMYTTCVIWVAFVPIYFGSESKIITMCICISLSAMVTLVFLFLPKIYIILIRPEKNIRALFTTSKTIRCHIGSRVASAVSHKTSSSFSSGPGPPYEYEYGERAIQTVSTPKPIIRSSACQTSIELLNAILDLDFTAYKNNISNNNYNINRNNQNISNNKTYENTHKPSIGWSELNINNLETHKLVNDESVTSSHQSIRNIVADTISHYSSIIGNSDLRKDDNSGFAVNKHSPLKRYNKVYDVDKFKITIKPQNGDVDHGRNKVILDTTISPKKTIIKSSSTSNLMATNVLQSTTNVLQSTSNSLSTTIIGTATTKNVNQNSLKPRSQLNRTGNRVIKINKTNVNSRNSNNHINSNKLLMPSKSHPNFTNKNNINICFQCAELEKSNSMYKINTNGESDKGPNYNKNDISIFTIHNNSSDNMIDSYSSGGALETTKILKTTISEESLSECSEISEHSCDCKLKSITIRIASPNFKL